MCIHCVTIAGCGSGTRLHAAIEARPAISKMRRNCFDIGTESAEAAAGFRPPGARAYVRPFLRVERQAGW